MLVDWWQWVARRWHGGVVVGWNVVQFDLQYLLKRSKARHRRAGRGAALDAGRHETICRQH